MAPHLITPNHWLSSGPRLVAQPHPFRPDRIEKTVCFGTTIADMLAEAGFEPRVLPFTQVSIEGWPIDRALWGRVRPKAGNTVYARVVPGKKKNPLRMVLMLAVMVLAVYTGGLALTALGPLGATVAGIGQAIVVAAVTAVGNMLVNAIAPAPKPKNNAPGLSRGEEVYGISGIRNAANPYGAVPELFGRIRVFPPLAAQTYTSIIGDDQFLHCLFTLGAGPFDLADFKIGETPIANFSGVEMQIRNLAAGEALPTLYNNDVEEEGLSVELVQGETPRIVVTRPDTDEIRLDITFPSLMFITEAGEQRAFGVSFRIDYRLVGAAEWINLAPSDSNSVTLDNWDEAGFLARYPDVARGWWNYGLGPRGWTFYQSVGRQDGYLPVLISTGTHSFSGQSTESKRFGLGWQPGVRGQYEVRIERVTGTTSGYGGTVQSDSFLTALRSVHFRPPVRGNFETLIAFKIKATGQLNGTIDQFNCIAHRHLPVWDGSGWTVRHTRAPAWAYVYGLRQGTAQPLPDHRMDLEYLKDWGDWAETYEGGELRCTFDARVDARSTLADFLREVASIGRASRSMRGGKFSIARDMPQSVAAQVFTPRNSWGFSGNRKFITLPHAIKAKFLDETKGYEAAETIVYNDGYDESTATLFEALEPFGCTRASQATRDARWTMAHAKLRPETFSLEADIENLACTRGDLVRIAHDVIRAGIGWGRVRALSLAGSDVAGVVVDEPVAMEAGKLYAIRFRRPAGGEALLSVLTQPGEQTALSFQSVVPPAVAPGEGDLFVFGEAERDSLEAIVLRIEPGRDLTAKLTFLPAAPELHTLDQQPVPAYTPPVTFRPAIVPAPVTDLAISEDVVYVGGLALPKPVASWRPAAGQYAAGFEVYERIAGQWMFITTTTAQRWPFDTRGRGASIEVAVIAVSTEGRKIDLSLASTVFRVLDGPTTRPADVARFGHEITGAGRHRFTWVMPVTRPNFAGVRLRMQAGQGRQWESAVALHDGLITASPWEVEALPSGTWTVLVKAVDTDGLESAAPAAITLGLGDALAQNVIETIEHRGLGWPGTETGCADVGGELLADDPGDKMYPVDATPFYGADDLPMYGADGASMYHPDDLPMYGADSLPMYPVIFGAMAYTAPFTPPAPALLQTVAEGDGPIGIWLRRLFPEPFYGSDELPMYGADADPMYPDQAEAFSPLIAGTRVTEQPYEIEVRIPAGSTRGRLGRFDVLYDVVDVVERLDDIVVPAGGLRLPITKPFRSIRNIQLTLQADGGTAAKAKIVDKNAGLGPLVACFDAGDAMVGGIVDAQVQGY